MKKYFYICLLAIFSLFFSFKHVQAIEGIDVSFWQQEIDFEKVRDDGIKIIYIRSSAGNSYIDGFFESNYRKATDAGLDVGFYHFLTARNETEAREQARFFASVIAGKKADCRLAMDFEVFKGLSKSEVNRIARTFLTNLKELTDKDLVIYSDAYNAREVFDESLFSEYPLWVAEYGVERPSVSNYIGWQYTDKGRINGIRGNVDRDIFDERIYQNNKEVIKEPEVLEKDKNKIIYYRVKLGDNLTKIARKYNVTLSSILKINKFKNPNLIFPNEVIKIEVDYKYHVTDKGFSNKYTIKKGNNLTYIANLYHVLVANLVTWNNIKNPNLIYTGDILTIKPNTNDHLIRYIFKKDNTLKEVAEYYKVSLFELMLINKIGNPNTVKENDIIYIPETYILEKH